ncbi:ATP-dependent nuclease [Falsiroseomonas oryzae]|uniref:ATP-dependent nuclease n=1 Tax=Falsiroseomonas oryzae TaxID=2766473 RepID=UPI0022EA30AD|nr:AAA family ATPase [Roseomonas sp. MO-31]
MIEHLTLKSFRKFQEFSIALKAGNILVGPNNAGKSSILDALRLLEACFRYTTNKTPVMMSAPGHGVVAGYEIPDTAFPFSMANATYNYTDDPAILTFQHANGTTAIIHFDPQSNTKFFVEGSTARLSTGAKFRSAFPVDFVLIPTLSPLEPDEQLVRDETVRRNAGNRLASRVLRNIWYRRTDSEFDEFAREIASAWTGIEIKKPELQRAEDRTFLRMYYAENRIDREVQWSGFGFQAWLQIQTHIRRATENSILVIDEPDVYLHPDLQRRLLSDIRTRFPQYVMATHAIEIINEADAGEIVAINNRQKSARRVRTDEDYQSVYRYIGSGENAAFARLAKAKKVIFVEGEDGRLLRRFASRLGFSALAQAESVPIVRLGDFSDLKRATSAVSALGRILQMDIQIACVFDRGYRSDLEIDEFLSDQPAENMQCFILPRNEIENFLLVSGALHRAVLHRMGERKAAALLPDGAIDILLNDAVSELRHLVEGQMIGHAIRYAKRVDQGIDEGAIAGSVVRKLSGAWDDLGKSCGLVPGKETFSMLLGMLRGRHGVSISDTSVIDAMQRSDFDPDLVRILRELNAFCEEAQEK